MTETADTTTETGFKVTKVLDAWGNFDTVLSAVSFGVDLVNALASDDPGAALLAMIGIDLGGGRAEYTIEDLREEMIAEIGKVMGQASLIALNQAEAAAKTAEVQLKTFLEAPSDAQRETVIEKAQEGLQATLKIANGIVDDPDSAASLSAAIMAVNEALAVRMAVVEMVQDGGWGMTVVQQEIREAAAFFDRAQAAYEDLRDAFLASDPVKVAYVDNPGHFAWDGFKVSGADVEDACRAIANSSMDITWDAIDDTLSFENGKQYLSFNPNSELAKTLVDKAGDAAFRSGGYLYVELARPGASDALKAAIDAVLTEAAAQKDGYTFETNKIGHLSDVYETLADGQSFVDPDGGNGYIEGTRGKDYLNGNGYHDELLGKGGRDRLDGGTGRDTLDGGSGRDVLRGGDDLDEDHFVFRNPETVDKVKEFDAEHDRIVLDIGRFLAEADWSVEDAEIAPPPDASAFPPFLAAMLGAAFKTLHDSAQSALSDAQTAAQEAYDDVSALVDEAIAALDAARADPSSQYFVVGEEHVTDETRLYQEGGRLYWDADGSGDSEAIHFATLVDAGDLGIDNFVFV